jgi:hypothetical protein
MAFKFRASPKPRTHGKDCGRHGQMGCRLLASQAQQVVEAHMRTTLLALIFAGAAPLAMTAAPSPAAAGAAVSLATSVTTPSAVMRVDYYYRRHHYRGYPVGYYDRGYRPAYYGRYYQAPRAYYGAPGFAPPVVYYPPVVVYYPPPVVAYPAPVAPYGYGAGYGAPAANYDAYSDW